MNDINLKDIVQYCRQIVDELSANTIVAVLREQNEKVDGALGIVEKYLPMAEKIMDQEVSDISMRAATMFLIALWSRLRQGGSVADLKAEDWNELANRVYEQAMEMDPKDFTKLVFDLYRRSIAFAIEPMKMNASETTIARLEEIVSLMNSYSEDLDSGAMPEAKYIEENLWLSLEAVFLVLTDRMSFSHIPEERRELAEAISALVFQKIRFSIYDKELAAIDECLKHQSDLDKKLTEQVNAYIDALNNELDEFDAMVERAFDATDFQAAFRGSKDLAKALGAKDILKNQKDIDNYFMS